MPLFSFEGRSPKIDPTAFVAPTATLIGDVTIEAGASVWFNTVLRADYAPVIVREGANVQDGSVLHAPPGIPVDIGPGATVAHMCVIHGAHVGAEALIANPDEVLVVGAPATVKGPIAGTGAEMWVNVNPQAYQDLARRYLTGLEPV
jgi:carbonic anhydrase/acetyltransferase-like protein (isoleucine patch superfamily)